MNKLTQTDIKLSPKARQDFAVVIPAFNEAPVIPSLIAELRETFENFDLTGEIIIVDDGSIDGTGDLAEKEACDWDLVRVLRHRANLGKTEAILTAVRSTKHTFIVLFDADLQHLPNEIPRFLEKISEGSSDIVTGRKIGFYNKAVVSTLYNVISRSIFRVPVNDLNSMKAFRREILDEIHLRHDWHRFFVVLAYARGYSVSEIDIELHPRRAGTSKYRGFFRIVVGVMDLMSIWFLLFFSRKPLILFGFSGVFLIGLGIILGGITFYFRFVEGFGFRPLLYLVILFETVGFLLVGFGFIAEMIANLREEIRSLRTGPH